MKHFFPAFLAFYLCESLSFAKPAPDDIRVHIQINRQRHGRFAPILAITEKRTDFWHLEDGSKGLRKFLITHFAKIPVEIEIFSPAKIRFFLESCDLARILALSNLENCEVGMHPIYFSLERGQSNLVSLNFLEDDAREVIFTLEN